MRDSSKNALTSSVFELEICSFSLNRSEFRHNLNGIILRVHVQNLRAQSEIGNYERDQRVSFFWKFKWTNKSLQWIQIKHGKQKKVEHKSGCFTVIKKE